jgi:hypothetical protein
LNWLKELYILLQSQNVASQEERAPNPLQQVAYERVLGMIQLLLVHNAETSEAKGVHQHLPL